MDRVGMLPVPWWVLLACLLGCALAAYLVLRNTRAGDSPGALFPLAAVLAPVLLVGAAVVAFALSSALYPLLDDKGASPSPSVRSERTGPAITEERTAPATTPEPAAPETTGPTGPSTASPSASPGASPSASPGASPSASASASASAGARNPR